MRYQFKFFVLFVNTARDRKLNIYHQKLEAERSKSNEVKQKKQNFEAVNNNFYQN